MVSRFAAEAATAAATGAFGAVIVMGALEFGVGWDSAGPQPGAFPFYVGSLIALASLGNFAGAVLRLRAGDPAIRASVLDRTQARRVAAFLLPLVAFVVLSVTVGMYVATLLYLAFSMRVQGGYGWLATLSVALVTSAFFYVTLERFFQIGLLKGPLERALGL